MIAATSAPRRDVGGSEPGSATAPSSRYHARDLQESATASAFAATLAGVLAPARQPIPATEPDRTRGAISELDGGGSASADPRGTAPTGTTPAGTTATGTADGAVAHGIAARGAGEPGAAGLSAYAAAADARASAATAPPTHVNTDSDTLNPEFRARLGRVIARMQTEFGHDVQMVEGFRPQQRQDYLYEQGRTTPGAVVTWTRSSRHTLGLAADLQIDGSYGNPAAYRQLARVAAQEGLRTLGPRDPGHVELASRGSAGAWGEGTGSGRSADANVSRAVDLVLSHAGLAAGEALGEGGQGDSMNTFLSRALRGTQPGAPAGPGGNAPGAPMMGGLARHGAGGFASGQQQGQGHGTARRGVDRMAPEPGAPAHVAEVAQVASVATVAGVAGVAHVATVATVAAPQPGGAADSAALPGSGATSAARVGHLLDVRDATPAQPLSRMTLALDNGSGGTDHITVNLRGGAVDAAISTGDSTRADRLSLRVGELQRALEHQGLDTGAIRVGATNQDTGTGWTPRHGSDSPSSEGRPSPNHRDASRQDADEPRQRSRREQQGRRK